MISSGIAAIDGLLHGGFGEGLVTDIFGPPASGKTQLVLQACANAVMGGGTVLFHDTRGEFRPERILEIIGGDEGMLEGIDVLRITNASEQESSLSGIGPGLSLVIVDGVTDLFSFEFDRTGRFLDGNVRLMRYMHGLSRASSECRVPVIVTNTVRFVDGAERENLGPAVSPFVHVRIHLSRETDVTHGVLTTAEKSLRFSFKITGAGVSSS